VVTRGQGPICLDGPVTAKVKAHPLARPDFDINCDTPLWFRPEARPIWMSLRDDVPMLLRGHFAAGESHFYDDLIAHLNEFVTSVSREFQPVKALCALFAENFGEAAHALVSETSDAPGDLVLNAALAGLVIACEEPLSEKLVVHLKSVAVALFLSEKYVQGATFLKIARLDKIAAEYLLGYGQLELALRFIRGLKGAEKTEMLLRLGARLMQLRRLFEALLTFVSCGEFQMVLHLMVEIGLVIDAFFVKKYIKLKGWLRPANPDVAKLAPEMLPLVELTARIDSDFASWAVDIGVDAADVKALLA
jgi:hypothetical protein